MSLLKLEHVSKSFPVSGAVAPLAILRDVSFDVNAGESVGIIGPSGSGKSTVLNLLGTLDQPTSGRIWFDGRDLGTLAEAELARLRNLEIGFIFQAHHLLPHCTVLENVLVPTVAGHANPRNGSSSNPAAADDRARRLLKRVGLAERLHHRPGQLSGGECQRVAVVRALINQPRLLLADEPTGALDRASAHALGQLLSGLNAEENVTLIVVTHALDLAHQMQRVLELRDGQLLTPVTP